MSTSPDVLTQIKEAVARVSALVEWAEHSDLSDLPDEKLLEARTIRMTTIEQLSPTGSEYRRAAAAALSKNPGDACRELAGILRGLQHAYELGYMRTVEDLVAAGLFGDFLEMSDHLLEA